MKNSSIVFAAVLCGLCTIQTPVAAQTWVASTNAPNKEWWAAACSADGTKLVAAVYGSGIYTSTNSGATWGISSAPTRNWYSLASSEMASNWRG
jgi:hypothetical protein